MRALHCFAKCDDAVVAQIEREKYRIYQAFMWVPLAVVKRLAHQAQKRLQRFQEQADNKDVDGMAEFEEMDQLEGSGDNGNNVMTDDHAVCGNVVATCY